jgi:tRNA(Ile)-lysidine synthase
MAPSAATLHAVLSAHMPLECRGLMVGLSGGADSAALLTALHAAPFRQLPVRAIHIDHGLQAQAEAFRDVCTSLCKRLNVPLKIIRVHVDVNAGASIEAGARRARYAALALEVGDRESLVTAHHREDQAETLLLQALRGAGIKGMAAMPFIKPFGRGWHVRPLLDLSQRELLKLGEQGAAVAVADPMNADLRFDRSYLRTHLWPRVLARWPGAAASLSRGARHMAQAQALLDHSAQTEVAKLRDGEALSITGLRSLSAARRISAVRFWISAAGAELPPTARLEEALRQVLSADQDQVPAIIWGGFALRRYRQRLFLTAAHPPRIQDAGMAWSTHAAEALVLGEALGCLQWIPQTGALDPTRLPAVLQVRRRSGGESLKLAPRANTHSVQHLCQRLGVLPWLRDALPFVFAGDELIAVGDLWLQTQYCVPAPEAGLGIAWRQAPIIV